MMTVRQAAGLEPMGLKPPRLGEKVELQKASFKGREFFVAPAAPESVPITFGHTSGASPIGHIVEVKEEEGCLKVTSALDAGHSDEEVRVTVWGGGGGGSSGAFIITDVERMRIGIAAPAPDPVPAPRPCPSKRRIGTFSICRSLIDTEDPTVMVALDGCVVVCCELNYASDRFEYTALHADFDERPYYGAPPIAYVPVIHVEHPNGITGGKTYRRTWEKQHP